MPESPANIPLYLMERVPVIPLQQFSKQTTSSMQCIPSDGKRSCRESFGIQKRTARALKLRHRNQCQICGVAIPLWGGLTYAEAHHIRPLGHPHNGPDTPSNMIILCPNHHAQCDLGAIRLDIESLRRVSDHIIDTEYIQYHNTKIAK